jgi:hypothetical protein
MPVIAIAAAVGTVSAGAAMGGILGGIMVAGGVMSGVGAVTGNKNLMKLGAVASLGAGIGSAMGLAGAADGAWNSMVGGADSALGVTGKSFLDAGGSLSGIGEAVGWKGATPSSVGGETTITQGAKPGLSADSTQQVGRLSADGGQVGLRVSNPAAEDTLKLVSDRAVPEGLVASKTAAVDQYSLAHQPTSINSSVASADRALNPNSSFIDKSLAFIKQNPEVVKAGSGLIGGAMTSYSQQRQQEAALQAQADARARYNQSILGQRWLRG